ncbi:SPRY domain-containing SOCS box protein 3-like [Babylonia areolata]|uniref:SPRY domain-containing SOCS box protein 3-like n=1 Tax=Babylonia areolata TaxID=304850 RepID=UPI003FD559B8
MPPSPLPPLFRHGCRDPWRWSLKDKSHEVRLRGSDRSTALFHPNWSNGTAGVRGSKPINNGVHYWEIRVSSRLFGTSMMFGVATRRARLHADSFHNLLGEDGHSWGLSHKGLAWHGGRSRPFCPPFTENVAVCVGLVYDGKEGTLAFYKDGESLGVAFRGVYPLGEEDLFPALCSTAAKTEMTLGVTRRAFLSLQDRCRAAVVQQMGKVGRGRETHRLPLPRVLCRYVGEEEAAG